MATNIINGHKYIGQTVRSLNLRINSHISEARTNHDNMYFHRALRKYGPKNFTWKILHECDNLEELNKYEADYIGLYNTFNNGYNCTYGGHGGVPGWKQSDEIKQIISKANKGNNKGNQFAKGNHSDETKRKMSENSGMVKAVVIDNNYFRSTVEAAKFIGVHYTTVVRRIKKQQTGYRYA